jgi:hypothetical protein
VSILFRRKVAMVSKHATRAKFVAKESKVPTAWLMSTSLLETSEQSDDALSWSLEGVLSM